MKTIKRFFTFILLCMLLMLWGCTTTKYVSIDIPEVEPSILANCGKLETISFKEGDTEIDVASKLFDERKAHKECSSLNEKKKIWIESLQRLSNKKK